MYLTDIERKELLEIARKAIREKLHERELPVDASKPHGNLVLECGAFVTLRLDGQLRGCIGYVESEHPLPITVADVAAKSATEDPRFIPVSLGELENIVIEISVLSQLVPLENSQSIIIGEHGLYLEGEHNRGLLLPQVAVENNWEKNTFFMQLGKKAGLPDFHPDYPGVKIFVFTADVFNDASINV